MKRKTKRTAEDERDRKRRPKGEPNKQSKNNKMLEIKLINNGYDYAF